MKGDRGYVLDNLAGLLEAVDSGAHRDQIFFLAGSNEETTVGDAVRSIINTGLLLRDGSTIHVSKFGKAWLENRDPKYLIAIIHAHVRFVGELLSELSDGPKSGVKLLDIAREKYEFGWTTSGPVHSRTKWLLAAGLIKSFSHKFHLNEDGRKFLAELSVYEPTTAIKSPEDLQPPPGVIANLLVNCEQPGNRSRAGSLYIPSVKTNNGHLEALRSLVEMCSSATSDVALVGKASSIFNCAQATAEACIRSLRLLGLLEKVSPTETSATPAALAWIASGYPIDLARVIHASIWYFGEIVAELNSSGRMRFSDILNACARYSFEESLEPLKRDGLTARIALLEAFGLIVYVSNHYYAATYLGAAFSQSVPCIAPRSEPKTSSSATSSEIPITEPSYGVLAPDNQSLRLEIGLDEQAATRIADNLIQAARLSHKSVELEIAVVKAFNFLGIAAVHLGGNGEPDGTATTRPGRLGKLFTIETKSAADGFVPEEQAKPATLTNHREQHVASSTIYIGPGFERRLLDVLDSDPKVAVLSTALLAEAVRRQVKTPLVPDELYPLIDPDLQEVERRQLLLDKWNEKIEWAVCLRGVVEVLGREADSPMADDDPEIMDVGWLELTDIRRSLRDVLGRAVSKELIRGVLDYLSDPHVGIAERADERYRMRVAQFAVPRRLRCLAQVWSVGDDHFIHTSAG